MEKDQRVLEGHRSEEAPVKERHRTRQDEHRVSEEGKQAST